MNTSTLLSKLGIKTATDLVACRDALAATAKAAKDLTQHQRLYPICEALKGVRPDLQLEFFESAGQDTDDRYRIRLTITGNAAEAKTVIEAFGLGDFDELLEREIVVETIGGRYHKAQSFVYEPDDSDSTFREVMDALTPIYGEFMETTVDIEEFHRDVATLLKPFNELGIPNTL